MVGVNEFFKNKEKGTKTKQYPRSIYSKSKNFFGNIVMKYSKEGSLKPDLLKERNETALGFIKIQHDRICEANMDYYMEMKLTFGKRKESSADMGEDVGHCDYKSKKPRVSMIIFFYSHFNIRWINTNIIFYLIR